MKTYDIDLRNKFRAYFFLFWPSVIVAVIPSTINGSTMYAIAVKVLLVFFQFVCIKNFVDTHYGE